MVSQKVCGPVKNKAERVPPDNAEAPLQPLKELRFLPQIRGLFHFTPRSLPVEWISIGRTKPGGLGPPALPRCKPFSTWRPDSRSP